jgi:hypothetical protein
LPELSCTRHADAHLSAIEKWLRDQLKDQRVDELFSAMDRMASVDEPAVMSPEDVAEEIATMRAERRAKSAS